MIPREVPKIVHVMLPMALACLGGCSTQSWIEMTSIGEQDKPLPTIRFSTRAVPGRDVFYRNVVLAPQEYEKLDAAVDQDYCANNKLPENVPSFGTFKITRKNGHVRLNCVLTRLQTCHFAKRFAAELSSSRYVLTELRVSIGCDLSPSDRAQVS